MLINRYVVDNSILIVAPMLLKEIRMKGELSIYDLTALKNDSFSFESLYLSLDFLYALNKIELSFDEENDYETKIIAII